MRSRRHLLTNDELASLLASCACIDVREQASWRAKAMRAMKRIAERVTRQKLT